MAPRIKWVHNGASSLASYQPILHGIASQEYIRYTFTIDVLKARIRPYRCSMISTIRMPTCYFYAWTILTYTLLIPVVGHLWSLRICIWETYRKKIVSTGVPEMKHEYIVRNRGSDFKNKKLYWRICAGNKLSVRCRKKYYAWEKRRNSEIDLSTPKHRGIRLAGASSLFNCNAISCVTLTKTLDESRISDNKHELTKQQH